VIIDLLLAWLVFLFGVGMIVLAGWLIGRSADKPPRKRRRTYGK